MPLAESKPFTLNDLRAARATGKKVPVLTCYDYTMARLMSAAGVPALLVGDSAASVVLGYPSTLSVSLSFMIEITAAVRRGAPNAFLIADMPFGSYHASTAQGVKNVVRMLKLSACDCIKLEVASSQLKLIKRLSDAGVAVLAHLGLRPQSVGLIGGYRSQGRTAEQAKLIVSDAVEMQNAGAAAILVEAVPAEVGAAVVAATNIPVIGCGAGPSCHASVIVTPDALGLTLNRPRFAPLLHDMAIPLTAALSEYCKRVVSGEYPAAEHQYEMSPEEKLKFLKV